MQSLGQVLQWIRRADNVVDDGQECLGFPFYTMGDLVPVAAVEPGVYTLWFRHEDMGDLRARHNCYRTEDVARHLMSRIIELSPALTWEALAERIRGPCGESVNAVVLCNVLEVFWGAVVQRRHGPKGARQLRSLFNELWSLRHDVVPEQVGLHSEDVMRELVHDEFNAMLDAWRDEQDKVRQHRLYESEHREVMKRINGVLSDLSEENDALEALRENPEATERDHRHVRMRMARAVSLSTQLITETDLESRAVRMHDHILAVIACEQRSDDAEAATVAACERVLRERLFG
jgi:hypothetical protein